jgi:hypothetical protein
VEAELAIKLRSSRSTRAGQQREIKRGDALALGLLAID